MGVVTINFIKFGSLLFEVTKNFRLFQKIMKRLLRGSSSRSSKEKQKEEEQKPKFNLPRTAEVRPCEWPSDEFLRRPGIYEDFYLLIENAGLTNFLHDQRHQYLLLTNTFVQNFYFFPKESPPSVEFHLYDVVKKMPLYEFCVVCNIPPNGILEEPPRKELEPFINLISMGETRKVSDARITSIHFPVLRYFALFASRCLIGRGNCGNLSVPDIIILFHGLYCDNTVSMGGIIARRLSLNRTKGPIFGGIYASRLAAHFNIAIRHYEKEEKVLLMLI